MKKLSLFFVLTMTALLFSGCGGNTIFKDMNLDNSALLLYQAEDNSSFNIHYMYQGDEYKAEFLKALSTVKASPVENWSFSDITFPLYGFSLFNSDRFEKLYAWSNNILYTPDGKKYKFEFNFEKMLKEYPFTDANQISGINYFPCAQQMILNDGKWNTAMMSRTEPAHKYDVSFECLSYEDQKAICRFTNNMDELYIFGEYYILQVQGDDQVWYNVPAADTLAFHDLAYELSPGQSYDMTYYLTPYGELPAGHYRILGGGIGDGSFDCDAEFDIE